MPSDLNQIIGKAYILRIRMLIIILELKNNQTALYKDISALIIP